MRVGWIRVPRYSVNWGWDETAALRACGRRKAGPSGRTGRVRDLSEHVGDIAGDVLTPAGLARLAALTRRPAADRGHAAGRAASWRLRRQCAQVRRHRAELCRPRRRIGHGGAVRAGRLQQVGPSCIVGPDDEVLIPKNSVKTDWEVELGVVIGAPAAGVSKADALKHVAGYCVVNDVSEREWQLERTATWDKGKGLRHLRPHRPVDGDLPMRSPTPAIWRCGLRWTAKRYQDGSTATMVFGVAIWSAIARPS